MTLPVISAVPSARSIERSAASYGVRRADELRVAVIPIEAMVAAPGQRQLVVPRNALVDDSRSFGTQLRHPSVGALGAHDGVVPNEIWRSCAELDTSGFRVAVGMYDGGGAVLCTPVVNRHDVGLLNRAAAYNSRRNRVRNCASCAVIMVVASVAAVNVHGDDAVLPAILLDVAARLGVAQVP